MHIREDLPFLSRVTLHFLRHPQELPRATRGYSGEAFETLYRDYLTKRQFTVNRKGFKLALNPKDKVLSPVIWKFKSYEPEITAEVCKTLKNEDTFIDVGANIGWYTLLAARLVGPKGRVLAIEPEPENYRFLRQSIELNGFKNVTTLMLCASNESTTATLHIREPVSHSLEIGEGGSTMAVRTRTLDEIVGMCGLQSIDLCKIDVEGAEPKVLEGSTGLIQGRRIKRIICEWDKKRWTGKSSLLNLLLRNYDISTLTGKRIQMPAFRRKKHLGVYGLLNFDGNVELNLL